MTGQEYQYQALHEGAALVDRRSRGRLLLTGADRRSYLQGLLTNDIAALTPGRGCYAAYLTPQGRMIADMRVFETGDSLLVDLDASRASGVAERWSQFIFSEDVAVEDMSARTTQVGIYGPQAARTCGSALHTPANPGGPGPSALTETLQHMALHDILVLPSAGGPLYVVRSDDIGIPGFDLISGSDLNFQDAHDCLVTADPDIVEACRIEASRPLFGVDMDEDTIPLEAGIEGRAISFTKGCYVGQEIVIRVLHRGHGRVAKKLVKLTFDAGVLVPPRGAALHTGDREIGTITSAAFSPAKQRPIALGYVHRDFVEGGTVVEWRTGAGVSTARVADASEPEPGTLNREP